MHVFLMAASAKIPQEVEQRLYEEEAMHDQGIQDGCMPGGSRP